LNNVRDRSYTTKSSDCGTRFTTKTKPATKAYLIHFFICFILRYQSEIFYPNNPQQYNCAVDYGRKEIIMCHFSVFFMIGKNVIEKHNSGNIHYLDYQ